LLENMGETLYANNGAGLAAPQIGIPKRVIVVDAGEGLVEFVNPEIVAGDGEESKIEGCLSIPGLNGMVKRKTRVVVKGLNRQGQEFELEATGLLARALQHEVDHLDGILFVDRAEWVAKQQGK
jgi:peptide deformylase